MANETNFIRPTLPGEQQGQEVRQASKDVAKAAFVGGSSNLPMNAVIEFPFEEPIVYEQDRPGSDKKNYFLGAKVNGKDRCILAGTFTRVDFLGDGMPISPEVSEYVSQFDNLWDLGVGLLGKKLKVTGLKACETSVWANGQPTEQTRIVRYPILEFIKD